METTEKMAADIALTMNGGEWKDGKWYSKGHREAWIKAVQPYADEIERLRIWNNRLQNKRMWVESALQFIAMAKPLDGQTWDEHSKQVKHYAIKALEWKEPD